MLRVQQFLWDRDESAVRLGAFVVAAIVYAAVSVLVLQEPNRFPPPIQVAIAALSLGGVVWIVESLATRLRTAAIRGTWVYRSESGNWGLATIRSKGTRLHYDVQLFGTADGLKECFGGSGTHWDTFLGHARSNFVEFIDRQVHIGYEINHSSPEYPARSGFLVLQQTGREGFERMVGYWTSTSRSEASSTGRLFFARPGDSIDAAIRSLVAAAKDRTTGAADGATT